MTADIAISTYKTEGISRIANAGLPHIPDVRYVISWQAHDNAPIPDTLTDRDDITVVRFDGHGQSHNRNNALIHCTSDIIIISDDDLNYFPENITYLIKAFEDHPDMDVATFRSIHDAAIHYPDTQTRLSIPLPRNYYVSCFEIALRRESEAGRLRFNPELGLNSPRLHGGEDEVFIYSAIRRGLNCQFIPLTLCEHPDVSTGLKGGLTPANLRAMGTVITLYYPATAPLRIILKALRLKRKAQSGFFKALYFLGQGLAGTPAFKHRTRRYL